MPEMNETNVNNVNDANNKNSKKRKYSKEYYKNRNKKWAEKINNNPFSEELQAKILTLLANGTTLSYIKQKFHIKTDNIYLKELLEKYNKNEIDVNSNGELFVPPSTALPHKLIDLTNQKTNDKDDEDDEDDEDDTDTDITISDIDEINKKKDEELFREIKINKDNNIDDTNIENLLDDKTKSININNAYNNIDKNKINKLNINGEGMKKIDIKNDNDEIDEINEIDENDSTEKKDSKSSTETSQSDDENEKFFKKITGKTKTGKPYASNDDIDDEILNRFPNILIIKGILTRLNLTPAQIKPIMLKYMSSSYSCDKNPEILYPTMIAMGVSQPKANLVVSEIKNALFGAPDDYSMQNTATSQQNANNPNIKPSYLINYDKTNNGYVANNLPPIPIDPEEIELRRDDKYQRRRLNNMISQAMETATMMKVINAANSPPVAPATPINTIVRQTPLIKDGAVVKDEYGNIVYITETVPINAGQTTQLAENPEIKEIKEAIKSLANKIDNNKPPVTKNDDSLVTSMISYFKDVANKSIDEKKEMENKYYNSLFTLLSENKKEIETKLKSLEQNSDPMSTIKYFNDIKKVIGTNDGNTANISAQLEIEKLKAQSMQEIEKSRMDFERWKEEQRMRAQEKAIELQTQRELKERELQFAKQTAEKNLAEMDRYMNFGKGIVDQFTPIVKEAAQGFLEAKTPIGRTVVKTDKEPDNNNNTNNNNTLNVSELSEKELEQILNNSNYVINKYNNEIIPIVQKELEKRKTQHQSQ